MDDTNQTQQEEVLEEKAEQDLSEEVKGNEDKKTSSKNSKKNEVEELKQKVRDLEDQLKRTVADYRNQSMRLEEEKKEFVKYANRELLVTLLPAFDTLFLAEKYVQDEGVKITIKHLIEKLKEVGVEKVNTEGEMFDAVKMEAVTTDEGEENKVLEELRPGYSLNGKLVRPAQVKVGKSNN